MPIILNGTTGPTFDAGQRITGDFSTTTIANRTMIQTSTSNSGTRVSAIPNGTASNCAFEAYGASNPTNASVGMLQVNASAVTLRSTITGTGTYFPLLLETNNTTQMTIATDGTITSALGGMQVRSGTAVSASGTSVDFTSIPSWVKRITVMFHGLSSNGSSIMQIQIGSGSVVTSGYKSTSSFSPSSGSFYAYATTGFIINTTYSSAGQINNGFFELTLVGSNTWVGSGNNGGDPILLCTYANAGQAPALGGVLDRVRLTTVNGTDTFDAGLINILYE